MEEVYGIMGTLFEVFALCSAIAHITAIPRPNNHERNLRLSCTVCKQYAFYTRTATNYTHITLYLLYIRRTGKFIRAKMFYPIFKKIYESLGMTGSQSEKKYLHFRSVKRKQRLTA